jgi:hypothetical protein
MKVRKDRTDDVAASSWREDKGKKGKGGTQWEIKVRKIRTRAGNRR